MNRPLIPLSVAFALGVYFSRQGQWEAGFLMAPLWASALGLAFIRKRAVFAIFLTAGFFLLGAIVEAEDRILPADSISRFNDSGQPDHAAGGGLGEQALADGLGQPDHAAGGGLDEQALADGLGQPDHAAGGGLDEQARASGSKRLSLTGTVVSLPEITQRGKLEIVSFVLAASKIKSVQYDGAVQGKAQVSLINSGARPAYGEKWQLYGVLKVPEEARYPGQFDYRRYLESRKIYRIFEAYGPRSARYLKKGSRSLLSFVLKIRETLKRKIDRYAPFPEREIMSALLIGFQKRIPAPIRDDFARTGTAHLLAVSGLNVSIVGGLLYFLLRFFLPRKLNAAFSLLLVGFYAAISGFSAPVLRAALMGGLVFASLLIDKSTELLNSLAVAFFLLLLFDSGNLFSASFQLSFFSVLGIFMFMSRLNRGQAGSGKHAGRGRVFFVFRKTAIFFGHILSATFAATIATLPLVLHYFRIASPVSFLANLALVPLMNLATFLGFLILPLFFIQSDWAALSVYLPLVPVKISLKINALLAQIPFASFYVPSPPLPIICAYYAIILTFVLLPADSKKWLRSGWIVSSLAVSVTVMAVYGLMHYREPGLKVYALHLKESSVAFLEFPGRRHNLLINTGKSRPGREWARIVKPFLISQGVQTVDAVLIGSCLARHSGGLEELLTDFRCRKIYLPLEAASHPAAKKRVLPLLKQRKLRPHFLDRSQIIDDYAGVTIQWRGEAGAFLEVNYGGKRGFFILKEPSAPLPEQDFVIRLTGRQWSKTLVESFRLG